MVDVPETFWLFGSGTPPWPSSRDWTANTVWLSMPEEDGMEGGRRNTLISHTLQISTAFWALVAVCFTEMWFSSLFLGF